MKYTLLAIFLHLTATGTGTFTGANREFQSNENCEVMRAAVAHGASETDPVILSDCQTGQEVAVFHFVVGPGKETP